MGLLKQDRHTRVDTSENEENKGDVVEPRSVWRRPIQQWTAILGVKSP